MRHHGIQERTSARSVSMALLCTKRAQERPPTPIAAAGYGRRMGLCVREGGSKRRDSRRSIADTHKDILPPTRTKAQNRQLRTALLNGPCCRPPATRQVQELPHPSAAAARGGLGGGRLGRHGQQGAGEHEEEQEGPLEGRRRRHGCACVGVCGVAVFARRLLLAKTRRSARATK